LSSQNPDIKAMVAIVTACKASIVELSKLKCSDISIEGKGLSISLAKRTVFVPNQNHVYQILAWVKIVIFKKDNSSAPLFSTSKQAISAKFKNAMNQSFRDFSKSL